MAAPLSCELAKAGADKAAAIPFGQRNDPRRMPGSMPRRHAPSGPRRSPGIALPPDPSAGKPDTVRAARQKNRCRQRNAPPKGATARPPPPPWSEFYARPELEAAVDPAPVGVAI